MARRSTSGSGDSGGRVKAGPKPMLPGALNPLGTDIAVLVVSYRSASQVEDLVGDLCQSPQAAFLHLSIVDNSLDAAEADRLSRVVGDHASRFAECILTVASANEGYAAGNNLAYSALRGQRLGMVFVMNPDIRLPKCDFADALAAAGRSDAVVVADEERESGEILSGIGALSLLSGRSSAPRRGVMRHLYREYPKGHFFGVTQRLWDRGSGLDERFFLYCEEVDLVLRHGLPASQLHVSSGFRVIHTGGLTTGSARRKSDTTRFHANRSRGILYRSHPGLRWFLPVMVPFRVALGIMDAVAAGGSTATLSGLVAGLRDPISRIQSGGGVR